MISTIISYLSLLFQTTAAFVAISLFKRTKFNSSWILISLGFFLMAVSRLFELFPAIYPHISDRMAVAQHWLEFVVSLVLLIGVFYIRKIFQFLRKVDEMRKETENKVLSAVIKTEEKERQRFAKELHDGLGPLLSVTKMLVSGLDTPSEVEGMNDKIRQNLKQSVDEAIACVREISVNISPHILNNFGLKDAIESFIKKFRTTEGLTVNFTTNIGKYRFNYNIEVIMYRVICELINNTLNHAKASIIEIDMQLRENVLYLEYEDNGIGFNVNREITRYGMGLDNMMYRLNSCGGDIKITSKQGAGMHASAYIKIQ